VENAAIREAKEETNLDIKLVHFVTYNHYLNKERGHVIFNNGSNQTEKELRISLENLLTKYFY